MHGQIMNNFLCGIGMKNSLSSVHWTSMSL